MAEGLGRESSHQQVPGRLSLGRRETGRHVHVHILPCLHISHTAWLSVYISHPARRHATDQRQILINKLDLVILRQGNFRQTARRNGISSLARLVPHVRLSSPIHPLSLSHSASSLKLASKSLPTCTASNLVESLDACSSIHPILSQHLTPEHATLGQQRSQAPVNDIRQ